MGCRKSNGGNRRNRGKETALFQKHLFVFCFEMNGKNKVHIVPVPGIHRTMDYGKGKKLIRRDTAFPEDGFPKVRVRIIRRKSKIGKSKHF
jgi:hypothetical protein